MMTRSQKALFVLSAALLAACASSATPEPAGPLGDVAMPAAESAVEPVATASTGSATFTEAQADRGRDTFRGMCTECHYSSEFSDSQFKFKWSRRSAGNLFALIQNEMPETAPGSLTPEEAVEIVSYILRMNGFDAGASELAPDRAVLDGVALASIRNQ